MNVDVYNEICNKHALIKPFEVKVDWYCGDITTETVIADDGERYYFEYGRTRNWYAPYELCAKINNLVT